MYILDTSSKFGKMTIKYFIFTIFCVVFSFVYLKLSFGVVSYYMKYLFLIPLILGVIVYFILDKLKFIKSYRMSAYLYNAAIMTLTIGSGVQGIFEICGAQSNYTFIYLVVSIIFIIIAAVNTIIKSILQKKEA